MTLALALASCVGLEASDNGGGIFSNQTGCLDGATAAQEPKVAALGDSAVYVTSRICAFGEGEGSAAEPFADFARAAEVSAGRTIVVLPGAYTEPLTITAGVDVIVVRPNETQLSASVRVSGAGESTLTGLRVAGADGVGVRVEQATVTLAESIVSATRAGGGKGHGVVVTDGGGLVLSGTAIIGSAGVGVLAKGAGAISIVEPIFDVSPRGEGEGKIGIVEPIFNPGALIADNAGGGIAIVEPIFSPKGDEAAPDLVVRGAYIRDNVGFGVALYGAGARIERSAIAATRKGNAGPWADGVLVAPGSEPRRARITLDEASVVVGNARGGVIALVASELELDADISANGYAGVWAAGDEGTVQIGAATTLYRNHLCGIAVTSGAALSLDGAAIADTAAASAGGDDDIGDGVGIFDGARADIRNARIVNSERAAILVHNAAKRADGSPDVTIEGSTFVGGKYAVVVNGAAAPDYAAANVYESEDGKQSGSGGRAPGAPADFDNADLPVATAYCEDGEACAPPASDD